MKDKVQFLLKITFTTVFLFMAACSTTDSNTDDEGGDMTLNLQTLTAETGFGTLQAERAENSFVGPLDAGQAIGVAFLDEVIAGDGQTGEDAIVVYVYDRPNLAIMIGELDDDDGAMLQSEPLSDFEASVDLVIDGDLVTGTVSFLGRQAVPFSAGPHRGAAAGGIPSNSNGRQAKKATFNLNGDKQ